MLIGITGKAGSGKTTLGNILVKRRFIDVAFADTLKSAAAIIFALPIEYFYDFELKEKPIGFWQLSPRQMLQKLGTEACRNNIDKDIWIKSLEASLSANFSPNNDIVITDVRFDNEAEMIRKKGGIVFHIVTSRESQLDDDTKAHASEVEVEFKQGDFLLWNDGTIDDLETEVSWLLNKLEKKSA